MPHPQIRSDTLLDCVENHAAWETGDPWEYGAIVDASFLESLTKLAARAPYKEKRDFLRKVGYVKS
jgi:hypothetical protein